MVTKKEYKPWYFCPKDDKVTLGDHIYLFFGIQHAKMFRGLPSINNIDVLDKGTLGLFWCAGVVSYAGGPMLGTYHTPTFGSYNP